MQPGDAKRRRPDTDGTAGGVQLCAIHCMIAPCSVVELSAAISTEHVAMHAVAVAVFGARDGPGSWGHRYTTFDQRRGHTAGMSR